jgi:hypothetical protein
LCIHIQLERSWDLLDQMITRERLASPDSRK